MCLFHLIGIEAGGHGHSRALPLLTLLPLIHRRFTSLPSPSPILLASGGLTSGTHLASLLTLNASGIVIGTRFLTTPSSLYSPAQKALLVSATSDMSVRSFAFDEVRGTLGWPEGVDGRGLRNRVVLDAVGGGGEDGGGLSVEERKKRYEEGVKNGDVNYMVTWAGAGVGLVDKIQPVEVRNTFFLLASLITPHTGLTNLFLRC